MNERHERLADRVTDLLLAMDLDVDRSAEGLWLVKQGSTVVVVSLVQDGDLSFVRMAALLLAGVRPELELVTRLMRLNAEVVLGAFQLFEDDTVAFTHTLLAEPLDAAAFTHALGYVARVGDDHDEELQALAGGRRAEDLLESA
jgi:hypothetical protein